MYCWKNMLKITGTWMEKKNCQMHGQVSQDSSYWTKGHLTEKHGPGGDLRGNKQPLVQTMYGQICGSICVMQHMGYREIKARQCQTIERNILHWTERWRIQAHNEIRSEKAMPCKIPINGRRETHRNFGKRKTKYACIVDADECTRPRLEGAGHKPHQDHITAKRDEFYNSL